ncbi:MAG: hypothetical protein HC853_15675 [Anaerolineae bacterium]|nr:hypothetical protein [Anaerolineae bacterium]
MCEGSIGREKRGAGGFGFDPVFKLAGDMHHLAELRAEEKHHISHRGVAGRKVIAFLSSRPNAPPSALGAGIKSPHSLRRKVCFSSN